MYCVFSGLLNISKLLHKLIQQFLMQATVTTIKF